MCQGNYVIYSHYKLYIIAAALKTDVIDISSTLWIPNMYCVAYHSNLICCTVVFRTLANLELLQTGELHNELIKKFKYQRAMEVW